MRPFACRLLLLSCAFALLLPAATAWAQDRERPTADELATDLTISLVRHMDLTPKQTTEVRPVMQDHAVQMLEIMPENPSMFSMMRVRGQVNDLMASTNERLLPLLTDVQAAQLDDYWDAQRKAMRERMRR